MACCTAAAARAVGPCVIAKCMKKRSSSLGLQWPWIEPSCPCLAALSCALFYLGWAMPSAWILKGDVCYGVPRHLLPHTEELPHIYIDTRMLLIAQELECTIHT